MCSKVQISEGTVEERRQVQTINESELYIDYGFFGGLVAMSELGELLDELYKYSNLREFQRAIFRKVEHGDRKYDLDNAPGPRG